MIRSRIQLIDNLHARRRHHHQRTREFCSSSNRSRNDDVGDNDKLCRLQQPTAPLPGAPDDAAGGRLSS